MANIKDKLLRLVWLEAFIALVDEGSYTKAAKKIGVSQPSVSRYVEYLEDWYGAELVVCRYPLQLSENGEAVVQTARDVVKLLHDGRREFGITPSTPAP